LTLIATDITEHKQADDKLRESEERFRTIFDNAADGILVANTETKEFYTGNRMICQTLGYSLEEIKKLKVMDIHRKKDLPYVIEQFENQSRKQFTLSKDVPVKRKDGSVFYADINAFPITLEEETYLLGIFRDVTERKNIEEELRKEKEQAQEYLKAAGVMLSTLNKDENITMINRKGCEILGYKAEELIGRNWFDILVPERIREEVRNVFRSLMTGNIEPTEYYENPLLTKDGEERLIAFHNTVLRGPNGQIVGTLTSGEDITDRRNSEKALRDSEHKYRVLLENLPQKIFLKDKNSVYVSCNENLAKDLGIKADEIAGKTDYDFLPQELAEKYRADDKRVVQSGETIDVEEKYNVGGQEAVIRTVKTPVRDQQGNVLGVLGIFWDITELKRAEEQLNEYREKMARAEQLASMGTLSATLVHELNQPLTVIRLAIEDSLSELQAKPCPQTVIEGLKDSLDEVANASSIIDRFHNFARQSSEETVSEVDLKVVAVRIVRLLSESALRANISLQIRDMDKLPSLYCNEKNIEQLFFALIDNAIHAADGKKNRRLIISGAVKDEYVELQFSDNCGGIAPKNLERIFEPFFTTKPAGEGTGLGLCIVQDITLRAGGKVRVKSKTGKGSTFFVTLPINRDSRFETRSNDK